MGPLLFANKLLVKKRNLLSLNTKHWINTRFISTIRIFRNNNRLFSLCQFSQFAQIYPLIPSDTYLLLVNWYLSVMYIDCLFTSAFVVRLQLIDIKTGCAMLQFLLWTQYFNKEWLFWCMSHLFRAQTLVTLIAFSLTCCAWLKRICVYN